MSNLNIEDLKKHIGKVGLFYDSDDEKTYKIGKLVDITANGNYIDEDKCLYDKFTPMTRSEMLEIIDLTFY